MARHATPVRAALALLVALAAAAPARAQQEQGPEVVEVDFAGAKHVAEAELRAAIRTRPSRCRSWLLRYVLPLCAFDRGIERHYLDDAVLSADELRLRLLYYERGYRDVQVESHAELRGDGAHVTFRVDEGEPVRVSRVSFQGEAERVPAVTAPPLPFAPGGPLDLGALRATRDTVQTRLRNRGFARAQVLSSYIIPTDSPYTAHVSYEVSPGDTAYFGEIVVEGASSVSDQVVRRMLAFRPGDLYREEAVLQSQRSLFGLELFTHATVAVDTEGQDPRLPVTVRVNEGDVHRVRVGAGINSLDCANAEGRWVSRSFRGGARRLEIRGRVANLLAEQLQDFPCLYAGTGSVFGRLNGALTADFVQPWFLGTRNALGAGLTVERRVVPDVFVRDTRGAYVSMTRRVGRRQSVSLAYRPALTDFVAGGDPFFCVSFQACDQRSIDVLRRPHFLSPVTASFVHEGAAPAFAPTRGLVARVDVEFASGFTGSDFPYARGSGEIAGYDGLGDDVVVAGRLRAGWARSIEAVAGDVDLGLHPQRRFFAGGPSSVRGYAQSRLGPKVLVIDGEELLARALQCDAVELNQGLCSADAVPAADFQPRPTGGTLLLEGNLELRFPLWGAALHGVTFLDVGQVWDETLERADLRELAWTPGLGVRYFSPIGPIRIDVGYNAHGAETLPVKSTQVELCRTDVPVRLCVDPEPDVDYHPALWEPRNTNRLQDLAAVEWDPWDPWWRRLQLHLSIGQAF